ncbi:MAG: hypothetical protein OXG09_07575 [Chloroflexi bacterium]|nr:hypothetical protein [Chloroflexota bacterium]
MSRERPQALSLLRLPTLSRALAGIAWLALVGALLPIVPPAQAQSAALIELSLDAAGIGYDGYYRAGLWLPIRVRISNHTESAIQASLVVRPQTSPESVVHTFSAPVFLPPEAGSRISVTLYIQPLEQARLLRLELLDAEGRVLSQENFRLQLVPPDDHLYMVISDTRSPAPLDLSAVRNGDARVRQGAWSVEHLPERHAALDGIDLLLISNADTGKMNARQQEALAGWVATGGHLIVTGGSTTARTTRTAAGLADLLPLRPGSNRDVADLSALAGFIGEETNLRADTSIAVGELHPQARVLLRHDAGEPLISQRDFGDGLVTYLSADPLAPPLNFWPGLGELWFTIALSANPIPGWAHDWKAWDPAIQAAEIMPGLDLLPNSLSLVGFLIAYIVVVGPFNYLLLSALRRREWAWLSIPTFIIFFSAGAWALGQQLRGTKVTLNRIAIVRSWPAEKLARVDEYLGLLSPRRDHLTLEVAPAVFLSAPPVSAEDDALSLQSDALLNIEQSNRFRAAEFAVDASLVSHFVLSGATEAPAIQGDAKLRFAGDGRTQILAGSVHNQSATPLFDPVLLFRNASLPLPASLEPGERQEFQLELANAYELREPGGAAAPASLVYTPGLRDEFSSRSLFRRIASGETSARELMGNEYAASRNRQNYPGSPEHWQRALRRRLLLDAIMNDHSRAPGRGNRLYLAGWSKESGSELALFGAESTTLVETLHLIALPVTFTVPETSVHIAAEQFTWHAPYTTVDDIGPQRFTLRPEDELVFEYIPLPEARLAAIDALHLVARVPSSVIYRLEMQLWDWQQEEWQAVELDVGPNAQPTILPEGWERYLGPLGRVRIRLTREEGGGFLNLNMIGVEFSGQYASDSAEISSVDAQG